MSLTPAEQAFFATGELQPGMPGGPAPAPGVEPAPGPDPLDLQALSTAPAPAPAPAAPAPAPAAPTGAAPAQPSDDPTEILRQNLAATQQQAAMLEGQLRAVLAQQQAQAQRANEPPPPDPSTDPIGHMMHQMSELQKQVLAIQMGVHNSTQQQQMAAQLQAFQQNVVRLREQFAAATPDYDAALNHIRNVRINDLRMFGLTDAQIAQQISQEEWGVAEAAISAGRNPAAVIYDMAKRHGYTPAAAAPGAAPAVPKPAAVSVADIQRAQAAAHSLPAGAPAAPDLSIEALRNASEADLNKLVMDPAAWNKIAGRDEYPL